MADQGEKGRIVDETAELLKRSPQTVYILLNKHTTTSPRKRRADAGTSAVSEEELLIIAAAAKEHVRLNGKSILPMELNIERLRANG